MAREDSHEIFGHQSIEIVRFNHDNNIRNDNELNELLLDVAIAQDGVLLNIQSIEDRNQNVLR